jgi:hypothetical protein
VNVAHQTFQVFTGAAPGGSSKNLEGLHCTMNALLIIIYFQSPTAFFNAASALSAS